MRIEYLSLPAFGMFTDQIIRFPAEYGLHIIYGPNEAGKSTILRALSDALFGIPHNSPDSFRHEPGKLRIAAGVSLADGTKLEFIRRKGRKSTILDPEGKPLPDEVLYPYTAGLSRSDFEDMFGLDHQRLREGGRRLLESGGSLGQSLFEAASGVRHLREVLADLDRQSGELFKPAGRNPTANRLAESYIESKRSIEAHRRGTDRCTHAP